MGLGQGWRPWPVILSPNTCAFRNISSARVQLIPSRSRLSCFCEKRPGRCSASINPFAVFGARNVFDPVTDKFENPELGVACVGGNFSI